MQAEKCPGHVKKSHSVLPRKLYVLHLKVSLSCGTDERTDVTDGTVPVCTGM